jgi:tetratricopeptide (TPR) repeat protein
VRVWVLVALLACACSRSPERPVLRPLAFPEMSTASADVRRRIRERFTSLEQAIGRRDIPDADLAATFGDMGKLLMAAEYYEAAEVSLENARELAPDDMRWPYYLGHLFRLRNDQPKAETFFGEAARLSPRNVPALVWLAEMHLQQNRPDDAGPLLATARAIEDSAAVQYGLGRVALERRKYDEAAAHFEAALALQPDGTRIHYPLSLAYRGLDQPAKAAAHLRLRGDGDVLPVDPVMDDLRGVLQNASAFELRGAQAIEERRWDDAVVELRKAVARSPASPFTRLNLATSLYMSGSADAALEQYQEAVRLSPSLARAHFGVGVIRSARGQDAEAIQAFTAAVTADGSYTEARFSLANALRRSGRVEEALRHYDAVLEADPSFSQAGFGYAMGLVRLGRYREARARLEADVKTYPDQPGFPHALARLLAAAPDATIRDGARAVTMIETLMAQGRSLATGETMAMALAESGRFEEAIRWQRDVLASARNGGRTELVPRLSENLQLYERRQPCRQPWPADDPVHRPQ